MVPKSYAMKNLQIVLSDWHFRKYKEKVRNSWKRLQKQKTNSILAKMARRQLITLIEIAL
jgi:hypothetical protein